MSSTLSPFDSSEYIDAMDNLIASSAEEESYSEDDAHSAGNVAIALLLVCGAGAATALGASVVFVPRLVSLASPKTLAVSLGLSAGVMLFVSFVEIFRKSELSFRDAGKSDDEAFVLAMACFFGGVMLMLVRTRALLYSALLCRYTLYSPLAEHSCQLL